MEKFKPLFPVGLYESHLLGELRGKKGSTFAISIGVSEEQASELRRRSLDTSDEAIQQLTSDRERFGENDYETWFAQGRTPFVLTEQSSGALAALVWFGKKKPHGVTDNNWHTIAYRTYPPYRGVGIMKEFSKRALTEYEKQHPESKIWAGINSGNQASEGLASALGFEKSETLSTSEHVVMVRVSEGA